MAHSDKEPGVLSTRAGSKTKENDRGSMEEEKESAGGRKQNDKGGVRDLSKGRYGAVIAE